MADKFDDKELLIEEETDVNEEDAVSLNYDIASYPSDYTLSGISQMWHDGDIEIPDYQREFVWNIKQSSLLIDSFLSGLPVPPVFFYMDENNKNLVIDGQQRILSVVFFMEGYFGQESTQGKRKVFRLTGLGDESPYQGKKFTDLTDADQRKIKQAVLRAVNIRQLEPVGESTSAFHIFERLNTGGTPLRPQEIRNCVFRGGFVSTLKELNKDKSWRGILGKPYLDKHQRDMEFLLRVFALYIDSDKYEKPMKEFLNVAMKANQAGTAAKVKTFTKIFPKVTSYVIAQIGEKPFHLRGPLNISALDAVMSVLLDNHKKLSKINLTKQYARLKKDKNFIEHTSYNTTDTKTVDARISTVRKYILGE